MNKWTNDDLEKVAVTIMIPKNTVAFIVNHLVIDGGRVVMSNIQYDSNDIEKLIEDNKKWVINYGVI